MGSLMAGWDSDVSDPKLARYTRNKSLTKEEIEAFWKSKKIKEEQHSPLTSPRTHLTSIFEEASKGVQRASSDPLPNMDQDMETDTTGLDNLIMKNGWWASSNWAFLNEPPVLQSDGATSSYTSQYHVADISGSNKDQGPTGI